MTKISERNKPPEWMFVDGNDKNTIGDIIKAPGGIYRINPNGTRELLHVLRDVGDPIPCLEGVVLWYNNTLTESGLLKDMTGNERHAVISGTISEDGVFSDDSSLTLTLPEDQVLIDLDIDNIFYNSEGNAKEVYLALINDGMSNGAIRIGSGGLVILDQEQTGEFKTRTDTFLAEEIGVPVGNLVSFFDSSMIDYIGKSIKKISLSGTGQEETDYIVPLNIHRGAELGDSGATEVFMNGLVGTDFSGLGAYLFDGTELEFFIASHGNHELVFDNAKTGRHNIVAPDGKIYASSVPDRGGPGVPGGVDVSTDNGATWTNIYASAADILLVDSRGYIYIYGGNEVLRSTDGGDNWSVVLDLASVSGEVQWEGTAEDSSGNIYIGQYQPGMTAVIRKSTDGGATFPSVWEDESARHVHGLGIDPYTGYIYAGIDEPAGLLRSTDDGATWEYIWDDTAADVNQMYFGDGFRLFCAGAGGAAEGSALTRTTDDETFTTVMPQGQAVMSIQELNGDLFAFAISYAKDRYPKIIKSTDNGLTWETIWMSHEADDSAFSGYEWVTAAGIPSGSSENQLLVGANSSGSITYPHARLFNGGNHYQALIYVKIPTLPADGCDIYISPRPTSLDSDSDLFGENPTPADTIARWKINEATGTTIEDSSGNDKDGVLTAGSGSWSEQSTVRAGSFYPPIKNRDNSFAFNGSYIEITGSGTDAVFQGIKGKTILAWINTTYRDASQHIVGKGYGLSYYGLFVAATTGQFGFWYANGSSLGGVYSGSLQGNTTVADGNDHLVGVSIDESTPANVTLLIDGIAYGPVELDFDYDPPTTNRAVRIGAKADGNSPFYGRINDIIYIDDNITELEFRALWEGRPVSSTPPTVTDTETTNKDLLNPSEGVFSWPVDPEVVQSVGLDNAIFNANATAKEFATSALAIAAMKSLDDDTYVFTGDTQIAIYSADSSALADRINRALR